MAPSPTLRKEGEAQLEEQAHFFFPRCGKKKADTVIQQSLCQDTGKNLGLSLETTPGYHYPPQ